MTEDVHMVNYPIRCFFQISMRVLFHFFLYKHTLTLDLPVMYRKKGEERHLNPEVNNFY